MTLTKEMSVHGEVRSLPPASSKGILSLFVCVAQVGGRVGGAFCVLSFYHSPQPSPQSLQKARDVS